MAEKQIHELATITNPTGTTVMPVSDGVITYKMPFSQWPYNFVARTSPDPAGVDGSLRYAQYVASTGIGWNPSTLGRSGFAWNDGSNWHSLLDARDQGRVPYRRLNSATAASYTLVAADVQFGLTIVYAGTTAKSITVPVMTDLQVPTTSLPSHGNIGIARKIEIIQAGSGAITLTQGSGFTLYGTTTTNGDNSRLILQYDTTTEGRAIRMAAA